MDVIGRPVLATEGLPQFVQDFGVEPVQRVLRFGLAVVEGRRLRVSRRADERRRGTGRAGQAGTPRLWGAGPGTAAGAARVDVVFVLHNRHHKSHG